MNKFKNVCYSLITVSLLAFGFQSCSNKKDNEPWTQKQLMQPAELAKIITDGNEPVTYIFDIGPSGRIKNSIEIGPGKESENIEKLKNEVSQLPKDANIVIYCGCCPFADCPNVRPAFTLLNELDFTNHKLLNISKNLKVDWIDQGFPMEN